jgi:hypothetical protein
MGKQVANVTEKINKFWTSGQQDEGADSVPDRKSNHLDQPLIQ